MTQRQQNITILLKYITLTTPLICAVIDMCFIYICYKSNNTLLQLRIFTILLLRKVENKRKDMLIQIRPFLFMYLQVH